MLFVHTPSPSWRAIGDTEASAVTRYQSGTRQMTDGVKHRPHDNARASQLNRSMQKPYTDVIAASPGRHRAAVDQGHVVQPRRCVRLRRLRLVSSRRRGSPTRGSSSRAARSAASAGTRSACGSFSGRSCRIPRTGRTSNGRTRGRSSAGRRRRSGRSGRSGRVGRVTHQDLTIPATRPQAVSALNVVRPPAPSVRRKARRPGVCGIMPQGPVLFSPNPGRRSAVTPPTIRCDRASTRRRRSTAAPAQPPPSSSRSAPASSTNRGASACGSRCSRRTG